eukprot:TRINITY_DN25078_c0_g1_i1.p1 TRINITY_DN25078_c0_g1~~TRINITY_DN25078_c0_g1_i1.p1  ORF type:complete len:678 (-),score=57.00 TRINITY_DN25078_c0_g1_i1:463-2496(-)
MQAQRDSVPDLAGTRSAGRSSVRRTSLVDENITMQEKVQALEIDLDRINIQEILAGSVARRRVDSMLEKTSYQVFVAACTLVSVALAAIETDIDASGSERSEIVWIAGIFVITVFAVDLGLRLYVYCAHFFNSSLNILEASLLCLDVVLELSNHLPEILGVLSVLKILRFVRMARILRGHAKTRELLLMIMGIMASIRALLFGVVLVFMTLTVFSILSVYFVRPVNQRLAEQGAFGDCSYCEDAFDNVMNANLHYLTTIVAGDSWGRQAVPLIREDTTAAVIVIGALLVINLGLLNTIAAVIVDRQVQARADDSAFMAAVAADQLQDSLKLLRTIFQHMDESGDERLSLGELEHFYSTSRLFRSMLNQLDIHAPDLPVIFNIFDTDRSGDLTFTEFVNGLHSIKNENLHTLMILTKHYSQSLFERFPDFSVLLSYQTEALDARFKEMLRCMNRIAGETANHETVFEDIVGGEPEESTSNSDVEKVSASSSRGPTSKEEVADVEINATLAGDSSGERQGVAPGSLMRRPPAESSECVELPLPGDIAELSDRDEKMGSSSRTLKAPAGPVACGVSSGDTRRPASMSPRVMPPDGLAEQVAVSSFADVLGTGEAQTMVSRSPRLIAPGKSAACVAVSSTSHGVSAGMKLRDIESVKLQRLGVITHAPIGRTPPKPKRLQD